MTKQFQLIRLLTFFEFVFFSSRLSCLPPRAFVKETFVFHVNVLLTHNDRGTFLIFVFLIFRFLIFGVLIFFGWEYKESQNFNVYVFTF